MNAAFIGKSGKSVLVAAGLSLLTASGAAAQNAPGALGSQATLSLSSYYANPPLGTTTLNGIPFTTGSSVQLGNQASSSYALSYRNPSKVYLLLNTANTSFWYDGSPVGTVTLTFANGASQNVDLVAGSNIREWAFGTDWTVDSLTDTANASNWWTGTRADDTSIAAGLDMLAVTVSSANSTSTLTGVSVTNTDDWGGLNILLAGLTVAYNPPASSPTVFRPGNSCNTPALVKSQAAGNASSMIFSSISPAKGTSANAANAGSTGAANSLRPCN